MFNKRLLTVEDYNSIVEHFGKAVIDYYTLDTRVLITDNWFAYDFIEIFRDTDSIKFKINNSLWTGGFYIKECNISNYSTKYDSDEIIVSGTGLEYVVLVLELSSEFYLENTYEMDFNPSYTPFIKPFYENLSLSIRFVDKTNAPVQEIPLYDYLNQSFEVTDSNGQVDITAPSGTVGNIDYGLSALAGIICAYSFPFIALKADLPVIITSDNIFKDKQNIVSFKFLFDETYNITENMLFSDNNIVLRVNGKNYPINEYNEGTFDFIIDLNDYFGDIVNMELFIGGNDYLNSNTLNFIEEVYYFTTEDIDVLKEEIEDENGADTIIFAGEELNQSINVNRDISIEFSNPVFNDENNVIPFIVDEKAVLTLKNLIYTTDNDTNVVLVNDGDLNCFNCNFEYCRSTVIYSKKGDVSVENSVFNNNYSCIYTNGNLFLYNSTFNLNDEDYVDTDSVAFIKVLTGLTIDYCKFNIELSNLSSLGLSYLFFKIGKNCIVNNVKSGNLLVNQSFPVKYNTSNVNVQSSRFIIHNSTNKCMIWTIEDTNTVYYNDMVVEYV